MKLPFLLFTLSAVLASASQAACLDEAQIQTLVSSYAAKTPVALPTALTDADAACTRTKFDVALRARGSKPIGYKIALTSQAMQKRFGTNQPVWGRLYADVLLTDSANIDPDFGVHPRFEADMLVRISSEAVNQAITAEDVLASIDQVIPFIELPDLLVQNPAQLDAAGLTAINAGARHGVSGRPVEVPPSSIQRARMLQGLADMRVTVADGSGARLGEGRGSDMLGGQPLLAVVWLAKALAQEGLYLRVGDLVSLGSFSPLLRPQKNLTVTVSYEGLPGSVPMRIDFK